MEFYNGQLCISKPELVDSGLISQPSYDQMIARRKAVVARRGGGPGKCALIVVDSLPGKLKEAVDRKFPDKDKIMLHEMFRSYYTIDEKARTTYSTFRLDDGRALPPEKVTEYTINASVIKAVQSLMDNTKLLRKATPGGRLSWEDAAAAIAFFKDEFGHTLPTSTLRFRKAVSKFNKIGYESLISGKFMNQNKRKVNHKIIRLLLSLDCQPERPFNSTVHDLYTSFICGEIDVYDPETGELYDPDDFTDKNGEPVALSLQTVNNYLNSPLNKALRAKFHETSWDYNQIYRPHHSRIAPSMAFSKISLDDRDLQRKMPDGTRVKSYLAYDVASGAIIGYAHSRSKDKDLFIACLRNMFQTIDRNGWNCPAEVEVEHHIVNNYADGLMKAGIMFPFVRWCNPGNSQEKRAEHFNRAKKYGVEKLSQVGIGRPHARLEANRTKQTKIYDASNDNYKEATYPYEQLVAEDIVAIKTYNNQLHPNQKLYPGMTRWEVLSCIQNPTLSPVDKALLYRFIGEQTQTTIRRNMYCSVRGVKFCLPSPEILERLAPHNYRVTAYYVPDQNGEISEVYLYQNDEYLATCTPINRYNEATAEQTPEDKAAYQEQAAYVARYDAMIKRNKAPRVKTMKKTMTAADDISVVVLPTSSDRTSNTATDWGRHFDPDSYAARAAEDI